MRHSFNFTLLCIFLTSACAARVAEDPSLLQLATCQQSWLDWKQDPAKLETFRAQFNSHYTEDGNDGSFVPKAPTTLHGQKVSRVFPQSVGMGVGYSVLLDAGFDATRRELVKQIGKPLEHCAKAEGLRMCEHLIGPKKTIILTEATVGKKPQTLVGCYYYYEK